MRKNINEEFKRNERMIFRNNDNEIKLKFVQFRQMIF